MIIMAKGKKPVGKTTRLARVNSAEHEQAEA
jgi:hypothetical protein